MEVFRHKLAQATKSLSLFIATLAVALLSTLTAIAAPGDYSWHKTPYQFQGDQMSWQSIASSADGTKLAAGAWNGFIYTSSDAGTTWTEQTAAGSRSWSSIAMSSDGTKLAAGAWNGFIYIAEPEGPATVSVALPSIPSTNQAEAVASPAGGNLASTGMNILVAIAAATGLVATALIVLVVSRRRMGLSRS